MKNLLLLPLIFCLIALVLLVLFFVIRKDFRQEGKNVFEPQILPPPWEFILEASPAEIDQGASEVSHKLISWNDNKYEFLHNCSGEVIQTSENLRSDIFTRPPSYCLGKNQLLFIDSAGVKSILDEDYVGLKYQAPFLINAKLLSESAKDRTLVVVSYAPVECAAGDPIDPDCGVGLPDNYFTLVVNLTDSSYRKIHYFPGSGEVVWNNGGSKAVILPKTCGGAGCHAEPLLGYNLEYDQVYTLTEQKATQTFDSTLATLGEKYFSDITGRLLAYWDNIQWLNENTVMADVYYPDNSITKIQVKF